MIFGQGTKILHAAWHGQKINKEWRQRPRRYKKIFNKELEDLTKRDNIIAEMKSTLEGINRRITGAEERIRKWEDRLVENNAVEQNKEKEFKK